MRVIIFSKKPDEKTKAALEKGREILNVQMIVGNRSLMVRLRSKKQKEATGFVGRKKNLCGSEIKSGTAEMLNHSDHDGVRRNSAVIYGIEGVTTRELACSIRNMIEREDRLLFFGRIETRILKKGVLPQFEFDSELSQD